jgi:hypothetical protein
MGVVAGANVSGTAIVVATGLTVVDARYGRVVVVSDLCITDCGAYCVPGVLATTRDPSWPDAAYALMPSNPSITTATAARTTDPRRRLRIVGSASGAGKSITG